MHVVIKVLNYIQIHGIIGFYSNYNNIMKINKSNCGTCIYRASIYLDSADEGRLQK